MDNFSRHERLANRIALIVLQLFREGAVSRLELASRFKVTERTIYRDLNRLGEFVTCSKDGIYRISMQNEAEDKLLPSLDCLSKKTGLSELLPAAGDDSLLKILKAIEYKRIKISPLPPEPLKSELQKKIFSSLDRAIKDSLLCVIYYKGKPRTIHPYRLMNLKGVWYLAATDAELMIKAFRLSAIEWLDTKKTTFTPDRDINDYLDSEDDAWFSMNKMEVTVEVLPSIVHYFERRNILPQQKIISKSLDGKLIVTTRIAHREQLFSTLRYWLPNVRIMSPETEANAFLMQLTQYLSQLTHENELLTNNVFQDND